MPQSRRYWQSFWRKCCSNDFFQHIFWSNLETCHDYNSKLLKSSNHINIPAKIIFSLREKSWVYHETPLPSSSLYVFDKLVSYMRFKLVNLASYIHDGTKFLSRVTLVLNIYLQMMYNSGRCAHRISIKLATFIAKQPLVHQHHHNINHHGRH